MLNINCILVPIDFSEHALAALAYAVQLADVFDAHVDVVHVIEEAAIAHVYGIEAVSPGFEELIDRTSRKLQEMLERERAGRAGDVHVEVGHPAAMIVRRASQIGADAIVISSHGRTGFRRFVMGSVAESVVRTASCPVITVKDFGKSTSETQE